MWRTRYPFFSMWQALLGTYAQQGVPPSVLKKYANLRSTFQTAWLDYVTLQPIDYKASFRCVCEGQPDGEPSHVIGDGIMLGYRADLAHLVSPWESVAGQPLKTGSIHQKRIFIAEESTRSLLLRFCKKAEKTSGGLTEAELETLRAGLSRPPTVSAMFLLDDPGVVRDKLFCNEGRREILFTLATNAPVCTMLPQQIEPITEHLARERKFSGLVEEKEVATRAPVLWDFLKRERSRGGGALSDAVILLLWRLLEVARQAYIEEPLDEVQRLRKRKVRDTDTEVGEETGKLFPNMFRSCRTDRVETKGAIEQNCGRPSFRSFCLLARPIFDERSGRYSGPRRGEGRDKGFSLGTDRHRLFFESQTFEWRCG